MNKEEWKDYKKLSGEITNKLDNTGAYESWLIIQEYVDRCQEQNQELKKQLANNGIVKTCENCEWFGTCPHSYKEYDYKNECEKLKKQIEELKMQNFNLREDIMIQKMALPHKEIKDKTFFDLYDMPTYKDLLNQQKEFIEYLEKMIVKEKEDINTIIELMKLPKEDLEHNGAYKFCISFIAKLEEILSKYKEIIGENNG